MQWQYIYTYQYGKSYITSSHVSASMQRVVWAMKTWSYINNNFNKYRTSLKSIPDNEPKYNIQTRKFKQYNYNFQGPPCFLHRSFMISILVITLLSFVPDIIEGIFPRKCFGTFNFTSNMQWTILLSIHCAFPPRSHVTKYTQPSNKY